MTRVWIYQANRILNSEEQKIVLNKLQVFTSNWNAHGKALAATVEIRYGLFIILSVDESQTLPTGCSIDSSVHFLKDIEEDLGIHLFDRTQIAFKHGDSIQVLDRSSFESLIQSGQVTNQTIVFNNLVQTAEDLASNWEVPLKDSWHARVFQV